MRILLAQCASTVGKSEANMAKLESIMRESEADIAIFPELYLTGYAPRDDVASMADGIEGPTVKRLSSLCKSLGRGLVVGLPLKHKKMAGQITNSALLIDENGGISRYDKTHLPTFGPFEESMHFSPGSDIQIANIKGIKVGCVICYDLFFPELTKLLALRGADLIACISASPTATVENFKRILPARAIENTCYVAYVNTVGTHLDLVFGGMSRLLDARGDLVAEAKPVEEQLIVAELEPSKIEMARRMRPALRDSRKEIFEAVADEMKFS